MEKTIILIILILNTAIFASKARSSNTILLITPRIKFNYKRDKILRHAIRKSCHCRVKTAFYKYVNLKMLRQISPYAIIIGGQNTPWIDYKEKNLKAVKEIIKTTNIPILGICGGHQLIASAYNGKLGWVNDKNRNKKTYRYCKRIRGYIKLDSFVHDSIFNGINENSKFLVKHCEVVKKVPKNFTVLASYKDLIYAMKHNKKLIYGTQFHPESSKAGRIILKNFINMSLNKIKK